MRLFILLLISSISFQSYAESIENYIIHNKQENTCKCNIKGTDFSENILTDAIENQIEDSNLLSCTYHCLGVYHYNDNVYEAIVAYKAAIEIRKQHNDNLLTAKSYRNLGYAYLKVNYPIKAIEAFLIAMDLNKDYQKNRIVNTYLSMSYRDIGEYEKALDYGHKALNVSDSKISKGKANNNLAIIYKEMNTPESLLLGIRNAQEAIQLLNETKAQVALAKAYNNLANILELLEQYDEAISAYQKALRIYKQDKPLDHAKILNNIALVLNKQNQHHKAIELIYKSLQTKQKQYNNDTYHPNYSPNYENLGDSYTGLGKYKTAIQNYDQALDNLKDKPKSDNPYIYNKPDYIRVLDLKAQAAKMNGDTELAHQIYQHIDDWITTFYKDLSTNTSKLVWIERAHKIYGNAIEVALMYDDKERAFQYAEKAHAVLLWQNLSQQAAVSLLTKEDQEKREDLIAQLRQAERQYQNGDTDISTLRALEKAQQEFEAQLEQDPDYARSKYQIESTTVAQVQNMIDENTAFIEYYWTDDVLRIFTITKEGLTVHTETSTDLDEQIAELRDIISSPKCDANCAKNTYNPLAFNLYKKLIPNQIQENAEINRFVIVADRAIGTLPFSALATQVSTANFDVDYPFLLYKYTTNYLYSAGSFLQFQQKNTHHATGFAGFAPMEYHIPDRDFLPLYKTKKEVEEIAQLYPRRQQEIYTETDANKQNFIKALQENHHTILLATHAQYHNSKGEIAFRDGVIDQNEIDQLSHIRTQRLILSACQTAKGKQNDGEGVLSLGWNFAYKGVPSITMNQWSVSENATMEIMIAYNELLRQGTPADQALQAAQINYLKETGKHQPCYWAAIVHAGNPDDVYTTIYTGNLGEMSLILLLIGVIVYVVRLRTLQE